MKLKRILLELRFAQRPCKRGRLHAVEPAGLLAPLRFSMRKATHMVELRGIEPLSESNLTGLSPGAVCYLHSLGAAGADTLRALVAS